MLGGGGKYSETLDIESTSFIVSDRQLEEGMQKGNNFLCLNTKCKQSRISTFLGAPILISDNEDFSDITNLLHNEYDEDEHYWKSKKEVTHTINICGQEVKPVNLKK